MVLGYIGLAGLVVSSLTNIALTVVGHKRILNGQEETKQEARSAYQEANGFNVKLQTLKEETQKSKGATAT